MRTTNGKDLESSIVLHLGIGILYASRICQPSLTSKDNTLTHIPHRSVCNITIYRVQETSQIGDPTNLHARDTYRLIALLTSPEALLGIISACLPLLTPLE